MFPYDDARYAAYLRRLTGAKGVASLTQLLDVMPVVSLAGDRPEDAFLRDERLLFARQDSIGGAGTYAGAQLELNDLETLAVVEGLVVTSTSGAYVTIGPPAIIGSGGSQVQPADTRVANSQGTLTKASLTGTVTAVPVASSRSLYLRAGQAFGPIVLYRARLYLESIAVNEMLTVNFTWREVPAPPPNR